MGYARVIYKKREEKESIAKKWTSVRIIKAMGT
jgi:hypothetical protein